VLLFGRRMMEAVVRASERGHSHNGCEQDRHEEAPGGGWSRRSLGRDAPGESHSSCFDGINIARREWWAQLAPPTDTLSIAGRGWLVAALIICGQVHLDPIRWWRSPSVAASIGISSRARVEIQAGFGIRDSGFGLRASGFGLRASGFGIRDSGFGIRKDKSQRGSGSRKSLIPNP
jgi:hypothetical protein